MKITREKRPDRVICKWKKEFDKKFPELSVIDGQGDEGSIHGYIANRYVKDFISKTLQQQRREILKEMEFNPETDNFELDVVKAEKIFSDLKENKRI
jgi:predicted transport protein